MSESRGSDLVLYLLANVPLEKLCGEECEFLFTGFGLVHLEAFSVLN